VLRALVLSGDQGVIEGANRGAWRELERELRPFVARRVSPADVDDVVQEIFVRLHRGGDALRDEERFGPWVMRVARNTIHDHHRAHGRRLARETAHSTSKPDEAAAGIDGSVEVDGSPEQELAAYAALFVAMMPSPYREALTLTELQGLSHQEAADVLGVSLPALKSRVLRGRAKLREALEACCHVALDARRRVIGFEPRPDGKLPETCCADEGCGPRSRE
jgi:RNA polymerase sigma-70 factor (ECF subfamily)